MEKSAKIYVAGHKGMVGSAIIRNLSEKGYSNFVVRPSAELDLKNQQAVQQFFETEKPDYVFLAAAKVGGIIANSTYRAQFIYENLMIQNNVIHQSHISGVKKLLFLGSSCIYPRMANQPIKEEYLLTGVLEPTNEPYAIAKIAGIKMCEAYRNQYGANFVSVMPTNLYGKNDNYNLELSHVLPALIRKMHLGKALMNNDWDTIRKDLTQNPVEKISGNNNQAECEQILSKYGIEKGRIVLWGTGSPLREFLHVNDMAAACVHVMQHYDAPDTFPAHLNVGCGTDLSIFDLSLLVKKIMQYNGEIVWDKTKPDGMPKKQLDISRLQALGWKPEISLEKGVEMVYSEYSQK